MRTIPSRLLEFLKPGETPKKNCQMLIFSYLEYS